MTNFDFDSWLEGIPALEEDHIFIPLGQEAPALTELYGRRAALLEPSLADEPADDDRALGESYTEARDELDEQIAAALDKHHADAPRIRLRALSDDDFVATRREVVAALQPASPDTPVDADAYTVETVVRYVARAAVKPTLTVEQVHALRGRLNQGEWARLVDHVTRMAHVEAEATSLPN